MEIPVLQEVDAIFGGETSVAEFQISESGIMQSITLNYSTFASPFSKALTRSAERDLERGRDRGLDFRRGFGCGREDVSEFDSDWGSASNELQMSSNLEENSSSTFC